MVVRMVIVSVVVVSMTRMVVGRTGVNAFLGRAPALHQQENSHP